MSRYVMRSSGKMTKHWDLGVSDGIQYPHFGTNLVKKNEKELQWPPGDRKAALPS